MLRGTTYAYVVAIRTKYLVFAFSARADANARRLRVNLFVLWEALRWRYELGQLNLDLSFLRHSVHLVSI